MTKLDPIRAPSEDGFAAALRQLCIAGACWAVARRVPGSESHMADTAAGHELEANRLIAAGLDLPLHRRGSHEVL